MLNKKCSWAYYYYFFFCFETFPEAHKYFVEFISKAYQALTDPVSRENYEKYGHPDGRQVIWTSVILDTLLKTKHIHVMFHGVRDKH